MLRINGQWQHKVLKLHDRDGKELKIDANTCVNGNTLWFKCWTTEANMKEWDKDKKQYVDSHVAAMRAFNPVTKVVYNDDNAVRLYLPQLEEYRFDPNKMIDLRFATEKQIKKIGGVVRAGATPYEIICGVQEAEKAFRKKTTVYNFRDVIFNRGLKYEEFSTKAMDWGHYCKVLKINNKLTLKAVKMIQATQVRIVTCHTIQPSFVPHENTIYLPSAEDFSNRYGLFEVLFHELCHWTKYNLPGCRRSYGYATEEIVAQQGAMMLLDYFGLGVSYGMLDYLKGWLRPLSQEDRDYVWSDAQETTEVMINRLLSFI